MIIEYLAGHIIQHRYASVTSVYSLDGTRRTSEKVWCGSEGDHLTDDAIGAPVEWIIYQDAAGRTRDFFCTPHWHTPPAPPTEA